MGTFEITRARQQLGFTPTTSAMTNIDVRGAGGTTGSAGQGILKGVSQFMAAREKQKEEMNAARAKQQKILEAIREKKQQMVDGNNAVIIQKDIDLAEQEYLQYKINNPQETWEAFRINQAKELSEKPAKLPFSPDALVEQQLKVSSYGEVAVAKALTDSMYQLRTDTIDAQYNGLVDAFRSGEPQRIVEFSRLYVGNGANMGKDKAEVLNDIKRAEAEGGNLKTTDLINGVHAAIENRNYMLAKELAKSSAIPETKQTTLRGIIESSEEEFNKEIIRKSINMIVQGVQNLDPSEAIKKINDAPSIPSEYKDEARAQYAKMKQEEQVAFENNINSELVKIDNTPNLSQLDFDNHASLLKNSILSSNILGTKKKKMLSDLENWRRGTNEIDYAKVLSLNQEMDAAQRSGIVDPTIQTRIMQASLEGAFGGRNKGGQRTYGDMIRRFEKLQFDERIQAVSSVVRDFERGNADDPRLIFLFHQAKNKLISEHPEWDSRELFIKISALSESYWVLPESTIVSKLSEKPQQTIQMISPDGKPFNVPINEKQRFLDNGFTE